MANPETFLRVTLAGRGCRSIWGGVQVIAPCHDREPLALVPEPRNKGQPFSSPQNEPAGSKSSYFAHSLSSTGNMSWICCRGISGGIEELLDDFDMCAPHMDSPEVGLVREALQLCRPAVELRGMGECPSPTGRAPCWSPETHSSEGTAG